MELALTYIIKNKERIEENERRLRLQDIPTDWYPMHGSTDHKVSVLAGRRTGKTANVALKALRSDKDVYIYVGKGSVHFMFDHIRRNIEKRNMNMQIADVGVDNETLTVLMTDGRVIVISRLPEPIREYDLASHDWTNKLILVDEYDGYQFEILMQQKQYEVQRAHQIICVGSMINTNMSYGKRWFNESNLHYYIDSENIATLDMSHRAEEFYPSRYRSLISNMPSLYMNEFSLF